MASLNAKMSREIDTKKAETKDLLAWYNENSGSKPITKFKDRAQAESRCTALREAILEMAARVTPKADKPAKGAKAEKADKPAKGAKAEKAQAEADEDGARGRKSEHGGKKIFRIAKENPRRPDTHGFRSWELIRDGMTYEEYLEAGGRSNDLRHDLNLGRVEVR